MTYCDQCSEEHRLPRSISQTRDTCELCGNFRDCNVQSDGPPMPAEELEKLFRHGKITQGDRGVIEIRTE